ncbi:MAG TPA: Ku protein [Candidatus Dormibacteraeota bacterium]|nr:Ku protein [Candidatus Dormibacteraeota bacterium]
MPRAIWTGTIGFGLVSVPVRLYPATKRKDVRFREIDRLSGRRIHHQKVVEHEPFLGDRMPLGQGFAAASSHAVPAPPSQLVSAVPPTRQAPLPLEPGSEPPVRAVSAADVLKGFEIGRDRYVTVQREELETLAPERSRTIDVEQFVEASAVDPIYYETTYYVVPERDHERAFGLLVEELAATKRTAIAWFVLRRKRYLAALRPYQRLMALSTMFYADEILPVSELEPAAPADLRKKEREMAALLITMLSGPFEPERYPDEYRRRLTALIEGRAASARPAPTEVLTGRGVQDLMAALQASVEQARASRKASKPSKPAARRKKKSA